MIDVLFVCTGNTCRSPLAEGLARREASDRGVPLVVRSAGTFASPGAPAAPHSIRVGLERRADLSDHRSRLLSRELLADVELAVAMSPAHLQAIRHLAPNVPAMLATEFLPLDDPRHGAEISDPFGGGEDEYEVVAGQLDACVRALVDWVAEQD